MAEESAGASGVRREALCQGAIPQFLIPVAGQIRSDIQYKQLQRAQRPDFFHRRGADAGMDDTCAFWSDGPTGAAHSRVAHRLQGKAQTVQKDDLIRPNERQVVSDPPQDAYLQFIGRIQTPWTDREMCPRQARDDGPECQLIVHPMWQEALDGLRAYERIEVLYWLDRSRRDLVTQSPKNDGTTTGTFALRSPVRPNPIGTSRVRLVGIEGCVVTVQSLDCLNGTPLLDIKPDRCAYSPAAPPKANVGDHAP